MLLSIGVLLKNLQNTLPYIKQDRMIKNWVEWIVIVYILLYQAKICASITKVIIICSICIITFMYTNIPFNFLVLSNQKNKKLLNQKY